MSQRMSCMTVGSLLDFMTCTKISSNRWDSHIEWELHILYKLGSLGYLPYSCTKNETMDSLHVDTLTVQRELPNYI